MTILEEAQSLVYGDRAKAYGHALDNWGHTMAMANAMWADKLKEPLSVEDGLRFMVLVKISRDMNKPSRDSIVDSAGYMGCIEQVREERERRASYATLDEVTKTRFENDLNWAERAAGAFGDTKEEWLKETR